MRSSRVAIAIAIAATLASCGAPLAPEGQVLLYVDTDAILPPAPGEALTDPAPLFDRLRVELFVQGEPCAACTREFTLDHRRTFAGNASFAVLNPSARGSVVARLRLFRTLGGFVVEPRATSTLEAFVRVPPTSAEGIVRVHVVLHTDDLGTPRGALDTPIDAEPGPALGRLAGTWASAYRVGCATAPNDDEVCVPGGAYWMGDPTNEGYPSERLIVVSPFFVNAHEVTVGELRARRGATLFEPLRRGVNDQCSYTTQPGANEALPVTCIARARAASYCAQTGGALISEAQWEYLARGRRSAAYPWGDDVPQCADAVFDRKTTSATCGKTGVGPSPAGQGTRDRVGDVVDLAGNVMEWMADEWAKDTETCWRAPLLYDPVCRQPGTADGPSLALRGGNWSDLAALMHGAYRQHVPTTMAVTVSDTVGFRCARPL